jgi:signal transduction histidine kinase
MLDRARRAFLDRWRRLARAFAGRPARPPAVLDDEFLAVFMHELRTPLQTMLSSTQLLRSAPRSPETIDHVLAILERNVYWQAQVLDDLLEMSRIVSGGLRLDIRPTRVAAIVESALDRIAPEARAKEVRLIWSSRSEEEVLADPNRMADVIRRLLSSAIRHSSSGGEVGVDLEPVGASIRITVADDGADSDPATSHVTGWFRRTADASVDEYVRFGVGFSNAQRVVEMHGGRVGAVSAGPGLAAKFFVTLPRASDSDRGRYATLRRLRARFGLHW